MGYMAYRFTGQEIACASTFWQDSDLGVFYAVDFAMSTTSPYGYAHQNSVSFVDPTGMVDQYHTDGYLRAQQEFYNQLNHQAQMKMYYSVMGISSQIYMTYLMNGQIYAKNLGDIYSMGDKIGDLPSCDQFKTNIERVDGGFIVNLTFTYNFSYAKVSERLDEHTIALSDFHRASLSWNEKVFVENNSELDRLSKCLSGFEIGLATQEGMLHYVGDAAQTYNGMLKVTSYGLGVIQMGIAWNKYIDNKTTGNLMRAVFQTSLLALKVNPFILVGTTILDLTGVSDKLNNNIDTYLIQWDSLIRNANKR
jgi:hypothetical protein